MSVGRSRATGWVEAALLAAFLLAGTGVCRAESFNVLVPAVVIYPRDVIKDNMLEDRQVSYRPQGAIAESRAQLVGKVARQTLLPGALIPASAVEEPRLVNIGHQVKMVFNVGGIVIVAYGLSLQSGTAGETVRARNIDSGINISGIVQPDGSLLVGGL